MAAKKPASTTRKQTAKKRALQSYLRREVGMNTADAIVKKLDMMTIKKSSRKEAQKMIAEELDKHYRRVKRYCLPVIWL